MLLFSTENTDRLLAYPKVALIHYTNLCRKSFNAFIKAITAFSNHKNDVRRIASQAIAK